MNTIYFVIPFKYDLNPAVLPLFEKWVLVMGTPWWVWMSWFVGSFLQSSFLFQLVGVICLC